MCLPSARSEFLMFGTLDILGQKIICVSSCPDHCRISNSISGLDTTSYDRQKSLGIARYHMGAKLPPAEY